MKLHAKVIHIAGSKGKGTTALLLAKILELSGHKVGLFTSPFLFSEEEMIQINGENISKADLDRLRVGLDGSEFENQTEAAFLYFNEQECDYVVLECGWGGAMDATNTVENKNLTILTHIELEHTEVLGDTVEKITKEKLGICRPGVPLLTVASQVPAVFETIENAGLEPILVPAVDLDDHHPESAGLAMAAAEHFGITVTPEIHAELENLKVPGRFEVLKWDKHTLILDGAHTYDSVLYLREKVLEYTLHHGLGDPFWAIHFLKDKAPGLNKLFVRNHTVWIDLDDERAGTAPEDLNAVSIDEFLESLEIEPAGRLVIFVGSFKLVAGVKREL